MRYGRQRWKLKGKIEVNGKQSWDGEEMVFLPLIVGLISIKVRTRTPCKQGRSQDAAFMHHQEKHSSRSLNSLKMRHH